MRRIYVAGGSTEKETIVRPYIERLKALGYVITFDWTATQGVDSELSRGARLRYAGQDAWGVRSANIVWAILPVQPSKGIWWELGFAHGNASHVIISGDWKGSIFTELADNLFDSHDLAFEMLANMIGRPE